MKKISLQWRLTIITAILIATVCVCLNFVLYKNGVYYIDSLQDIVTSQDSKSNDFGDVYKRQILNTGI